MDFQTAIRTCFQKYATFSGRASRPEFWWFTLFLFLCNLGLAILDGLIFGFGENDGQLFGVLFGLATFLPSLAVGARRLHDIGRSGWWLLISLIPLIGIIVLIVWWATKSDPGDNTHGPAAPTA